MNILAVDPGKSGAVVLLRPYSPNPIGIRRDFKFWEEIVEAVDELSTFADAAVIELVGSMPGEGVVSVETFARYAAVAAGALRSNGFSSIGSTNRKLIFVPPNTWKGYFWDPMEVPRGTGQRRGMDSVEVCKTYCPEIVPFLTRVKDHNTADAALMAVWYRDHPEAEGTIRSRDKKAVAQILKKRMKK